MKYYLVVYKDGTMSVFAQQQIARNHQPRARFFECAPNATIEDISEATSLDFKITTHERLSKLFNNYHMD